MVIIDESPGIIEMGSAIIAESLGVRSGSLEVTGFSLKQPEYTITESKNTFRSKTLHICSPLGLMIGNQIVYTVYLK